MPSLSSSKIFCLIALFCLVGCSEEAKISTVEEDAAVVLGQHDVAFVKQGTIQTGYAVTGSLEPYQIIHIKAQVDGTISNLRGDRGQSVRRGRTLSHIEAVGVINQAVSAEAAVMAAEAQRSLSQQQMESAKVLYEAGAMAELDFEGVKTAFEAAQAQVATAEAQAMGAKERAKYATITAPIDGIISERLVEEGEAVRVGDDLFTVVNIDILELAGQVSASMISHIEIGQSVVFSIDGFPGEVFSGKVDRIEPTADPQTRQVGVYLRLPNPNRTLVGGLFAKGRIISLDMLDAMLVPEDAIRTTGGALHVFVVENGVILRQPVTVLMRDESQGQVAIEGDVSKGTPVLVVSTGQLTEGTTVQLAANVSPNADSEE